MSGGMLLRMKMGGDTHRCTSFIYRVGYIRLRDSVNIEYIQDFAIRRYSC